MQAGAPAVGSRFLFFLRVLVLLAAEVLEIALGHVAGRLGDALPFDGLRSLLAGLFDLLRDLDGSLLLEISARGITADFFLPLGVETRIQFDFLGLHIAALRLRPAACTLHRIIASL